MGSRLLAAKQTACSQLRPMTTVIFDDKERGDETRFFRQAEAEAIAQMKREKERAERERSVAGKAAPKESTATATSEKPPGRTARKVVCSDNVYDAAPRLRRNG